MLLTIAAPSSAHANDTSETEEYHQLAGDFFISCAENQGGVCFDINPDAEAVDLVVNDDVTDPTGAYFEVQNEAGDPLESGSFCGSSDEIDLTGLSGAVAVLVWVDGPVFGPLDCFGSAGIATTGSVTATWHIPAEA